MDGARLAGKIEVRFWTGWILSIKSHPGVVSGETNPVMVAGRGRHLHFACSEGASSWPLREFDMCPPDLRGR